MTAIHTLDLDTWAPPTPQDNGAALARELESGRVLYFPKLRFRFEKNALPRQIAEWTPRQIHPPIMYEPAYWTRD